jgi:putative membrane protein
VYDEERGVIRRGRFLDKTLKLALIIGGIIMAALAILSVVPGTIWGGRGYGYGYGLMGPGMMGGYGSMFLMPVVGIAVLGLIVWAVVAAVQRVGESHAGTRSGESARDILEKRYARGEIDKGEFDTKRKDLGA